MGAGSKFSTKEQKESFFNGGNDNKISIINKCIMKGEHYLQKDHSIGIRKFMNINTRYYIEKCNHCKAEYVVEI